MYSDFFWKLGALVFRPGEVFCFHKTELCLVRDGEKKEFNINYDQHDLLVWALDEDWTGETDGVYDLKECYDQAQEQEQEQDEEEGEEDEVVLENNSGDEEII